MTFSISFRGQSPLNARDLVDDRGQPALGATRQSIIVTRSDDKFVGRWDDESADTTTFVTGSLTNVPSPELPGIGNAAAKALSNLYSRHSVQAFAEVDGAFCAVVLDWRRSTVLIARDKLGICRAYLSRERDRIIFSDSLADLLKADGARFELDIDSIYTFLMIGWIPAPNSMFRGIEKVPPGTLLKFSDGKIAQSAYYDLPHLRSEWSHGSATAIAKEVATRLDQSVDRGVATASSWGSFLSGGIDSSTVVSSLARDQSKSFPTYFGGFSPELNQYLPNPEEPEMSQLVAERFHTNHHMLWLGPEELKSAPTIVGALEEPVCDGGCIVLGAVMRAARSEVDGLMTGIGGDFLFTGERRHMVPKLLRIIRPIPNFIWRGLIWLTGLPGLATHARISQFHFDLERLVSLQKLSMEDMYAGFFLQANAQELKSLFRPETMKKVTRNPLQEIHELFEEAKDLDPLSRMLYVDLKSNTPDHCVREAETLGRHFGLQIYNPFLDSELVDFAMRIPASSKVSGLELKIPLKSSMRGRVPDKVLDRKKGGLGSPIRWWVTQPNGFVAGVLSRQNIERRGFLSADTVEQFRRDTAQGSRDYSKLLWSLFTLELWMQKFVD